MAYEIGTIAEMLDAFVAQTNSTYQPIFGARARQIEMGKPVC
jgi:hypothetical protein